MKYDIGDIIIVKYNTPNFNVGDNIEIVDRYFNLPEPKYRCKIEEVTAWVWEKDLMCKKELLYMFDEVPY